MSRSRTFRKTKIALLGNLPDKEKIPNWIKHAGGKISASKDLEVDVTHLIVSKEAWRDYHPITKEARRRGTVYIMKVAWLTDSISINKNKLLDEVQSKYAWEPEHARRISSKIKRMQRKIRKAKKDAELDDKREAWTNGVNDDTGPTITDRIAETDVDPAGKCFLKTRPAKPRKSCAKPKEIIDAGIKLDKNLLESERDMALLNRYRPYVGADGMPHLVTLVRNDIAKKIKEQYDIKAIRNFFVTGSNTPDTKLNFDMMKHPPRMSQRFTISKTTFPRYFDDTSCGASARPRAEIVDEKESVSLDGGSEKVSHSRPKKAASTTPPQKSLEAWDQHLPFSTYPIATYDSDLTLKDAYGVTLESRVHIPQPFAHSLQLYESFDYNEDRNTDLNILTPTTTNTSFTSYLTQSSQSTKAMSLSSRTTPTGKRISGAALPKEKKYYLLHKYTRKCRGKSVIASEVLAPMDSSWDFAYRMFCKFFKLKTGMSWEQAKKSSLAVPDHQQNVVSLESMPDDAVVIEKTLSEVSTAADSAETRDITTSLGASFFESSVQAPSPQRKSFRYVPNAMEDLQEISNAYAERYRENWLPSRAKVHPRSSHSQVAESCRTWAEVVAGSKL